MNELKSLLHLWIRENPEFTANLKDNTTDSLIEAVLQTGNYIVRQGEIVNQKTNLAANVGEVVKNHARPFLKTLGQGRYIPKFSDRRTQQERDAQAKDTEAKLMEWVKRKGYAFISDEIVSAWAQYISKTMAYESEDNGSFTLSPLLNGVPVKQYTPEQVFMHIGKYLDPEKTRLNQLRIENKISNEALQLSGEDAKDIKNKVRFSEIKSLLEKEYYSILPTKVKLPKVPESDLINDLEKEEAHRAGLPVDSTAWSLSERTQVAARAKNRLEEADKQAFQALEKFTAERTPKFYQEVHQRHSGLPYDASQ